MNTNDLMNAIHELNNELRNIHSDIELSMFDIENSEPLEDNAKYMALEDKEDKVSAMLKMVKTLETMAKELA